MNFVYQETLRPNHSWELPFLVSEPGVFRLSVMASLPVNVFLTDLKGRDAYRAGSPVKVWYQSPSAQIHSDTIALLPGGWFVIVTNRQDAEIKVQAEGAFGEFS